MSGIAQ